MIAEHSRYIFHETRSCVNEIARPQSHMKGDESSPEAPPTLTVLSHGRRQRLQHLLCQIDEHLVELAPTQQVEVLDNLQGVCTHISTHTRAQVYTERGGRDLELLQETRLLHHQRPQVLRDTDTQS